MEWQILDRDLTQHPLPFRKIKPGERYSLKGNDFGYVHQNSTIPSHAFYMAEQKIHLPILAQIWFRAMLNMKPDENFARFAQKTITIAKDVPQIGKRLANILTNSWRHVNVAV